MNLELKRVVPFTFQTKVEIDKRRQDSHYSTENTMQSDPVVIASSLGDLLREGWQGRRFYKIIKDEVELV